MNKKLSLEEAEKLADELLASQPRQSMSKVARAVATFVAGASEGPSLEFEKNPWVTPAAPAYDVMHRHVDTTGKW